MADDGQPFAGEVFKLVLIGDSGVGKSSLLVRFADDKYEDSYISTVGVDFRSREVKLGDKVARLQIWDTAGQERFKTITSAYYRGADGIILVYDVTNPESFEHVEEWLTEVNRYADDATVKLLVGSKADLKSEYQVPEAVAQQFAEQNNLLFILTSAKTSTNVDAAFLTLAKQLLKRRPGGPAPLPNPDQIKVKLFRNFHHEIRIFGCCPSHWSRHQFFG
jgi:Ras-related protein Rab-1A